MAITTYAELKTAVENWLDHQLFTSRVPEFIALFEATASRRLRVRQQEASATLSVTNGAAALPTDYLLWRRVRSVNGSVSTVLEYVTPEYLLSAYPDTTAGDARVFTIIGETINIRPVPASSTSQLMAYYAKVVALSDAAPTNWLLTAHPDVYLFGSLVEAEMFGVNDERMPLWKARRDEIFDEIEKLSNKTRGVGGMRVMDATP